MEKIGWWSTYLGDEEIEAANRVMAAKSYSQGRETEALEDEICQRLNVNGAVVTTSGSAALLMSLLASEISPGDEVIVPDVTWIATAHAVHLLGAKVVLAETEASRPVLDVGKIEKLITDKTKAIMPVHLNGRAVDMDRLTPLAKRNGLTIIEDAAQALASKCNGAYLGTIGDIGIFSLSLTKLVSTGQGGVVVTNNDALLQKLRAIRVHGVENYGHEERYTQLGFNFKFSDVLAGIGRAQFSRLSDKVKHVTEVYQRYSQGLQGIKGISLIPVEIERGEVPVWTEILCNDRDAVISFLDGKEIGTRPYHPAIHSAPYFAPAPNHTNAIKFANHGLVLPSGPSQPFEAVDKTIEILRAYGETC